MLQSIRDKTSGWIAYLIVFLISIPFALWGVNSYLGGGEILPAATVDGQEISLQNLDTAYGNYRRRLEQVFGGSIPAPFNDETLMKDEVLTQMIEEFAMRSYIDKNRFRISDRQLNQAIRSMDVFQMDGQFDQEIYQRQVASQGYSTAGFESELRRTQAMQQLRTGIAATAFSIPSDRENLAALTNQTRSIRTLTRQINIENYSVSDEEINSHFEKNQARYMTDEQVKVDYIELSLDGIKSTIEIDSVQIRNRYEQTKDIYTSAEVRTASHILLTLSTDASEQDSQEAEDLLKDIRSQIEAGAEFAQLATEYSQDPVSAEEGGDLGEVERGMMVQPFEAALFELQVGQISQPVKTSFGWHLIKLNEVSGGNLRSFEDVSGEIEDEIKTELAESQIYDLTENLANLAYEQADSLLPAAEQLGLTMLTSEWFGRFSGESIAAEAKIRSAAFSPDVFTERLNSEAIELADNRIVFIHLNDYMPAAPKSLEDVRDNIVSEIKQKKSREENTAAGNKALEALKSGQSLDSVASDWNIEIVGPLELSRKSSDANADIVKLAFTMTKPVTGSVFQGFTHVNGDYSVVELLGINIGDTELSNEQVSSLNTAIASQEFQSVLKVVSSRADVVRTPTSDLDF